MWPVAPSRLVGSLPPVAGTLLGRDEDLVALAQLIALRRLVTPLGSGGIGKTRLALAVADAARATYPDGVWWVDLAPLQSASQIGLAIAQVAELQPGQLRDDDAGLRIGQALAGRDGLLVLDNAEHVVAPLVSLLHALLQAATSLRVLVTSQQRLAVAGEQAYRLAPLAPAPALQLLLQRALAADHRYALHGEQLERASGLCRQLDGIPLALEMAGARLPLLGLEALYSRLGERLRLLGADGGAVPARQRTLQAALEWSHAMLSAGEQAVLRRLSVFAAPFRLESAQQVAADSALDEMAALHAVAALVDKSLLQVHAAPGADQPRRYRLLETTRLFAARALEEFGEKPAAEARHAQAMAALADRAQAAYWTRSDGDWMDAWRADHDDFVLGFDRACAAGDAESAALLGEALHATANLNGLYGPVQDRLPAALRLLPLAGPLARARLWNRSSVAAVPGLSRLEATARRLQAWRIAGEPMGLARALAQRASELERAGDAQAADAALAELRQLEQSDWPPRQQVMGVALAGLNIASHRADAAWVRRSMLAWLTLAQAGGLWRVSAQARNNLGQPAMLEGRPDVALVTLRAAAAEYRALGCSIDLGCNLGHQAAAMLACGDAAAARDLIEQGLMTTDAPEALLQFADTLAPLALQFGRVEQAAQLLGAALPLRARLGVIRRGWETQREAQLCDALAGALDAATLARYQAEGARLSLVELRRALLDWLQAAR
jgi:predicted ATPase